MAKELKVGMRVVDNNYSTKRDAVIVAFAEPAKEYGTRLAKVEYSGLFKRTRWVSADYLHVIESSPDKEGG